MVKRMLENLKDFLKNEAYRVSLVPSGVHILNYKRIIDINDKSVIISLKNVSVTIKGNNLRLIKLDKNEILINGKVERLEINEK